MLIRSVRMTFQMESIEKFLQNFETYKGYIRNFPGCHHLELWQDYHKKNIFMTYSIWESEESLDKYRDSELFKTVWSLTKPLFLEKPQAFSSKKVEQVKK